MRRACTALAASLLAACSIDLSALQQPPADDGSLNPATDPESSGAGSGAGGTVASAGQPAAGAKPPLATGSGGSPAEQPARSGAGGSATVRRTCGLTGLPCCMPGNTCDLGACLRGKCTAYGGFYARQAGCTQNPCTSRNTYTAGCGCPMGFEDTLLWQRSLTCDTGEAATEVRSCTAARTPETAFGGVWVQGPDPACKPSCRTPNPLTDGCGCPDGTRPLALTVDEPTPACVGSSYTLQVCIDAAGTALNFGGAYATSQRAANGCAAANPFTGACTCPPEVNAPQSLHMGDWSVFVCNL